MLKTKKGFYKLRFQPINYLNLLKINMYLAKRKLKLRYKKGAVPSVVNRSFIKHKTDAAFISSLVSRRYKRVSLGICADYKVWSVLLVRGAVCNDPASASSNALAKVLKLQGKTIIGDEALRQFAKGIDAVDLAAKWRQKTNLPFVFAALSVHKNVCFFKKLAKHFPKKIYIPDRIIAIEAAKRGLDKKLAKEYLELIQHKIDSKKTVALKRFWRAERISRVA
jgi:chorismate dehydratase